MDSTLLSTSVFLHGVYTLILHSLCTFSACRQELDGVVETFSTFNAEYLGEQCNDGCVED